MRPWGAARGMYVVGCTKLYPPTLPLHYDPTNCTPTLVYAPVVGQFVDSAPATNCAGVRKLAQGSVGGGGRIHLRGSRGPKPGAIQPKCSPFVLSENNEKYSYRSFFREGMRNLL